jgi:hypothetical protein
VGTSGGRLRAGNGGGPRWGELTRGMSVGPTGGMPGGPRVPRSPAPRSPPGSSTGPASSSCRGWSTPRRCSWCR